MMHMMALCYAYGDVYVMFVRKLARIHKLCIAFHSYEPHVLEKIRILTFRKEKR